VAFEETGDGVRVTTNESFAGDPVNADVAGIQAQLDASLIAWLEHLKSAAESGPEYTPVDSRREAGSRRPRPPLPTPAG